MNEPLRQNQSSVEKPIEDRLKVLEESVRILGAYNQSLSTSLSHVVEQLKNAYSLADWVSRTSRKAENYQSLQALMQASKIFPKSRSVMFVSKGYFGDNAKYAFIAFCEYARDKEIAVHYLTDDPKQRDMLIAAGLPALLADPAGWSADDIRALFSTKVVVLNDNFHATALKNHKAFGMLHGAKTIQMWHGIPVKDIGLRHLLRSDGVLLEELIASAGPYDVFAAPGAAAREEWSRLFSFSDFAPTGYPRNDVLFREPSDLDMLNVDRDTYGLFKVAQRNGKPTILYGPTYRDDQASGWLTKARVGAIANHARMKGYVFAVNLHPFEQHNIEEFRKLYPGVSFVAPGTDVYPIVRHASILISDYSSLAFDYLLLDRPLIFYRPDHDYYVKHARGLIEGRVNMTPGAVTTNIDQLIPAIDAAVTFTREPATDPHATARRELRAKLFDHVDGRAGERLCEVIMRQVEAE